MSRRALAAGVRAGALSAATAESLPVVVPGSGLAWLCFSTRAATPDRAPWMHFWVVWLLLFSRARRRALFCSRSCASRLAHHPRATGLVLLAHRRFSVGLRCTAGGVVALVGLVLVPTPLQRFNCAFACVSFLFHSVLLFSSPLARRRCRRRYPRVRPVPFARFRRCCDGTSSLLSLVILYFDLGFTNTPVSPLPCRSRPVPSRPVPCPWTLSGGLVCPRQRRYADYRLDNLRVPSHPYFRPGQAAGFDRVDRVECIDPLTNERRRTDDERTNDDERTTHNARRTTHDA